MTPASMSRRRPLSTEQTVPRPGNPVSVLTQHRSGLIERQAEVREEDRLGSPQRVKVICESNQFIGSLQHRARICGRPATPLASHRVFRFAPRHTVPTCQTATPLARKPSWLCPICPYVAAIFATAASQT